MQMSDLLFAFEATNKGILESSAEWARAIQGERCHDVIFTAGMDLAQSGAHARTFNLKTTDRLPCFHSLRCLCIVRRNGLQRGDQIGISSGLAFRDELSNIPE